MVSLFDLSLAVGGAPAADLDFFALPYPNDLRLDPDGTPSLRNYHRSDDFLGGYLDVIDGHAHGFGPTQAAYVRWSAALDPASLPDPAATQRDDAAVFMVDVTPGSVHRGEKIPLRLRFTEKAFDFIGENWLALQPMPGLPPREGETYAVVVTDAVHGDGAAEAPAALRRVLDGAPDGELETRAATTYAPLAAWLDEQGLRDRVAAATVYTTEVASSVMDELRTAVLATPAPTLTTFVHDSTANRYELYTGTYDAPNFQEGDPPYLATGGEIHRGASGKPEPVRTESMRVALSVPKGTMPDGGWPVVVYSHGTGGNYKSFANDATAEELSLVTAKDGTELARFCVISIDQVLHGPRSPAGTDVQIAFFNFNNLIAARDNVKQGALDGFQLLRLVKAIDIAQAPDTGQQIKLDPTKIYYFGHSQGSITGGLYVAADPDIKAAIFSGAGAGLVAALLTKTAPVDIASLVQSFFHDQVDDFHPFLNLLQGYFDESDSSNYLRRLFLEPPPGMAPKNVFVSLGLRDSYSPVPTIETFGLAAGVVPVNPMLAPIEALPLTGRAFADAPQAGNVAGGVTGVLVEYDPGTRDDGHFVIFDVRAAVAQSTRFLGTHAKGGVARLDPP